MAATMDWADGSTEAVRKRVLAAGVSERKSRLFSAACCRASQKQIRHPPCLELLDLVEAWADDPGREPEVARGRRIVARWNGGHSRGGVSSERDFVMRWSVYCAADPEVVPLNRWFLMIARFRKILREIVGPQLPMP